MNKNDKFLDYGVLIKTNLLNVVKYALEKTSQYGLSDDHHFFITFRTNFKGNQIPEYLTKEYPENMIIVIENEYWNLKTYENHFLIDLKFKGKIETLKIFFSSIKNFVDPSVSFNLNLDVVDKRKSSNIKEKKENKNQLENKSNIIFLNPNK
tara:strand:+ start:198 stop:653 length:456 start_codon:yes stop_codon:yes gene_type:complete